MEKEIDEVKKIITGLLVSSPLQIDLGILDRDYYDQIGERIPFRRLGFNTLENCLRFMPDVLEVKGHGPHAEIVLRVSNKSAHINDLVTKQKANPPKRKPRFGGPSVRPRRSNYPQRKPCLPIAPVPPPSRIVPNFAPPLMSLVLTPPISPIHFKTKQIPSTSNFNILEEPIILHNVASSPSEKSTFKESTDTSSVPQCGTIPKQKDFSNASVVEFDSDEPSEGDIYMSDTDDELSIIDTSLENTTTHFYNITSDSIYNCKNFDGSSPSKPETNVPLSVQNNLKILISKYDDGIWCGSLPERYKEMFSKELDYVEYGYRGLINMCLELTDIFHCTRPDTGDFKLYNKQKPLPKDFDKSFKMSKILKHFNEYNNLSSTEPALIDPEQFVDKTFVYPDNVFELGEEILRQFIPPNVRENDYIEVSVGEVYDPTKFWLLLNDYSEQLDDLMDEIQPFYNSVGTEYSIPEHMVVDGMYCVAKYHFEYHRAIIVNTIKSVKDRVKVYYVDYGTVSAVNPNTLKFLHRKFCGMPQQAIRCRLASIYPPCEMTQWTIEASNRFLSLVSNKILIGHIHSIDYERQILEVFLADTSGDIDIYMNDTLVEEGYAIFTNQEQEKVTLEPQATPWVKHLHKFPTFIEIEHSAVPSAEEMARLLQTGMPLEQIYPRYFCQEITKKDELLSNELKDKELTKEDQNSIKTKENYAIHNKTIEENKPIQKTYLEKASSSLVEDKLNNIKHIDECVQVDAKEIEKCSDLIVATPATRPPPGFKNVIPSHSFTTTTHVALDPVQNTIVTQTTNVNHTNTDLFNMLLSQQNYGLSQLSHNLPQMQQPVTPPNPLLFTYFQQQLNNTQMYQNSYSPFLNQLNYLNQQNNISGTQSHRSIVHDLILRDILQNNDSKVKFIEFLVYYQALPSSVPTNSLCNYLITNIPNNMTPSCNTNYNYYFYQFLNILSDREIIELSEFLNQSPWSRLNMARTEGMPTSTDYLSNIFKQLHCKTSSPEIEKNHTQSKQPTVEDPWKRRLVIQTEIKCHKFHVIWYNQEAHVNVEELLNFIGNKAPIEEIRREILMKDASLTIIDLPLNNNIKFHNELSRYITIEKNKILHLIAASSISKILPLLNKKFQHFHGFEDLFEKISPYSDLWFNS